MVPLVLAALGRPGKLVVARDRRDGIRRATTVHTQQPFSRAIGLGGGVKVGVVGVELGVMPVVPLTRSTDSYRSLKAKRSLSDEGLRSGGCICQGWDSLADSGQQQ